MFLDNAKIQRTKNEILGNIPKLLINNVNARSYFSAHHHPDIVKGGSFFGDIGDAFKKVGHTVADVGSVASGALGLKNAYNAVQDAMTPIESIALDLGVPEGVAELAPLAVVGAGIPVFLHGDADMRLRSKLSKLKS